MKKEKPYVIVRASKAGVFAGTLESHKGTEVVLSHARRLWYWSGAASLSQLSVDGVSRPSECKFPVTVSSVTLIDVFEILSCSEKARKNIAAVPVWSK